MNREKKERLVSKDYILIIIAALGPAMTNSLFGISMALYVPHIGASQLQAGFLVSIFALAAFIVRPVAGILTDNFGRVKLLVGSAFAGSLFCFLFGIAGGSIPLLLAIRAAQGFGFGVHSTAAGAVSADVVPQSRRAEGIGYFAMHLNVAQAVGPIIALAIVSGDSATLSDFRTLFFTGAALFFVSVIVNSCITYERKRRKAALAQGQNEPPPDAAPVPEKSNEPFDNSALPKTILGFEYTVFAPVSVMILVTFATASIIIFLTPLMNSVGIANPWPYFLVNVAGVLTARMIFGKIADKRGYDIVIIPWLVVMAVGLMGLLFVRSMAVLIALAFPIGVAQGAVVPTLNAMFFRRCSPQRRGSASSAFFGAIDCGFAAGAPILGAVADAFDFRAVFWAATIFAVLALVLYLLIASDKRFYARHSA